MTQTAEQAPTTTAAKPSRRKVLPRILWSIGTLVVAVGSFWTWSFYVALAERARLIGVLQARGEPVFWNDLADKLLKERSEETGAGLFMKAIWTLGGELNRGGPRVPTIKLEDELKDHRRTPAVRPVVQQELKLAEPALALFEEAVKRPPGLLTTAIKTESPISILLPHIQDARKVARLLHWVAYDALARGDASKAYDSVRLCLDVSEQLRVEPFLVSQLVRLAVRGAAAETLSMCLSHAPVPEKEFRALDRRFAAADDGFGVESAWMSERCMWMWMLEDPKQLKDLLRFGGTWSGNEFTRFAKARWYDLLASPVGRPAALRTQSALIELTEKTAKLIDRPGVDSEERRALFEAFQRDAPLTQLGVDVGDWGFGSFNAFHAACEKRHRQNVMTRLALRLLRHFDEHGAFPSKLEDLCDADMPRLRLDWFENKPIVYLPSATGFRLEVPDELLTNADRERKKHHPGDATELAIVVEIKYKPPRKR